MYIYLYRYISIYMYREPILTALLPIFPYRITSGPYPKAGRIRVSVSSIRSSTGSSTTWASRRSSNPNRRRNQLPTGEVVKEATC